MALVALDTSGRVRAFNVLAASLLEREAGEALGRPFLDLFPEARKEVCAAQGRLFTGGEAPRRELVTRRRRDGAEQVIEVASSSIRSRDPAALLLALTDVTARETSERERERVVRRLIVQRDVARLLAESRDVRRAMAGILERFCMELDWDIGGFWTVVPERNVLRCDLTWAREDAAVEDFERKTHEIELALGDGLPGRVWATGIASWVRDVTADGGFVRSALRGMGLSLQRGLNGSAAGPSVLMRCMSGQAKSAADVTARSSVRKRLVMVPRK